MTEICKEVGVVSSALGETARVDVVRTHDCGSCKACIFSQKGEIELSVRNPVGAKVGDRVELAVNKSSGMTLLATIIGLGIPLALMAVSIVVCSVVALPEWVNLLISVCVLALGFLIVWLVDKFARKTKMCAEITAVLPETESEDASEKVKNEDNGR